MNMSKQKEDTLKIPVLSREARNRRNKRLKWERINEASHEPGDNVSPEFSESPESSTEFDIVFNPLKV